MDHFYKMAEKEYIIYFQVDYFYKMAEEEFTSYFRVDYFYKWQKMKNKIKTARNKFIFCRIDFSIFKNVDSSYQAYFLNQGFILSS